MALGSSPGRHFLRIEDPFFDGVGVKVTTGLLIQKSLNLAGKVEGQRHHYGGQRGEHLFEEIHCLKSYLFKGARLSRILDGVYYFRRFRATRVPALAPSPGG